jgi:chemotaxis regulatin CheY-phosphate phosphatase CheZ
MGANEAAQETLRNTQFMKKALADTPRADARLAEAVLSLETRLREALRELVGDRTVRRRSEATLPSIMDRVSGQITTTCPITETAKRDYEIAADSFGTLLQKMHVLIEQDLKSLGDRLEAAGAPWTPGRRLPDWKK